MHTPRFIQFMHAIMVALLFTASLHAAPATQPASVPPTPHALRVFQGESKIVIRGTLETSMDYLRVEVRLREGDRVLTGEAAPLDGLKNFQDINDLNDLLDGKQKAKRTEKFIAFLDTGASANVISKSTAQRFGIEALPDAVYHEVGLHGATPMNVSKPYEYSVRGVNPANANAPMRVIDPKAIFQISKADGNPLVEMVMGEVNVIGMPVIKRFVVEVRPGDSGTLSEKELENLDISDLQKPEIMAKLEKASASPTVTLHDANHPIKNADVTIPLVYANFSRRKNPLDKGPLPDLADNPTIQNIKIQLGDKTSTGSWLLDTGAPANLISTKQAQAIGLFTPEGRPTREPDFSLPLGGIGGKVEDVPGFRIDHLMIPALDGKTLDYVNAYVLVNDVTTTLDSGETVTLDGVMGTGLWFPTVAGVGAGFPTNAAPSAFEAFWIDCPGKRLALQFRKEYAKAAATQKAH